MHPSEKRLVSAAETTVAMPRRRAFLSAAVVGVTGFSGCTGLLGTGDSSEPDGNVIELTGTNEFNPDEMTVQTGTTVTWEWTSPNHNIVVDSQPDDADWDGHEQIESSGHTYEHTFTVAGQYDYYCKPHQSTGMTGTIHVEEGEEEQEE